MDQTSVPTPLQLPQMKVERTTSNVFQLCMYGVGDYVWVKICAINISTAKVVTCIACFQFIITQEIVSVVLEIVVYLFLHYVHCSCV